MHVKDPVFTYKVCYRGKPGCQWIKLGLHGTFPDKERAVEQAAKCAEHFNIDRKVRIQVDPKTNKKTEMIEEARHDRVEVWIEEYKDGFYNEVTLNADGSPRAAAAVKAVKAG